MNKQFLKDNARRVNEHLALYASDDFRAKQVVLDTVAILVMSEDEFRLTGDLSLGSTDAQFKALEDALDTAFAEAGIDTSALDVRW